MLDSSPILWTHRFACIVESQNQNAILILLDEVFVKAVHKREHFLLSDGPKAIEMMNVNYSISKQMFDSSV